MRSASPRSHRVYDGLLVFAVLGLVAGAVSYLAGAAGAAGAAWAATTVVGVVAAGCFVVAAARERRLGADVVAVLALVGALVVREYAAGAVITVMLASGRALERRALQRAHRDLGALLARAPRLAHRYEGTQITDPALDSIRPGDLLLVKPGEVVPVDGLVEDHTAVIDESALTGEPLPVERTVGNRVRSGTVNAGNAFDLRATTSSDGSTYAGIVRLVAEADAGGAPFVRVADRFAGLFVLVSVVVAAAAWLLSGELVRAVAVLVVATPCPLILAVPVALVSGLSRTARRGVVVKSGTALEQLARGEVLLFDKTGTITRGDPVVVEVVASADAQPDDVLRYAASIDQVSPHVLAAAVVREARERGLALALPVDVQEVPGQGAQGVVDGHRVVVGRPAFVGARAGTGWARTARRRAELDGMMTVFVGVEGRPIGAILLDDPIRTDAARTIRRLRRDGIRRVVMVTGDRAETAQMVGTVIGVDDVLAERTPAEKVDAVRLERRHGRTLMVGDGINDAPALAVADVGVAVGARGATIASESADAVLTVDRLDRLGEAVFIARRARRIAMQSVVAGIGMSVAAMAMAAIGWLPPAAGALLQELIDVAVILNALRVLRVDARSATLERAEADLARRFQVEHRMLRPDLGRLRDVADALSAVPPAQALVLLHEVHRFLVDELAPHEEAEDAQLYPVLERVLGGTDPTALMSRAHVEIAHLIRRLGRLLDEVGPDGPDADEIVELRRLLYGLHAVLDLHFAQEDEGYLSLVDDDTAVREIAAGTAAPS